MKMLIGVTSGLFISMVPMLGAFIFCNGPEWVRLFNGLHIVLSCTLLMATIFTGAFIYLVE